MRYSLTAAFALVLAAGIGGTAAAQSMAMPGPTPDSWGSAVPGPPGPGLPDTSYTTGSGGSMPPLGQPPLTSPDNPQAPLGAGEFSTGGQMFAR